MEKILWLHKGGKKIHIIAYLHGKALRRGQHQVKIVCSLELTYWSVQCFKIYNITTGNHYTE